MMNEEQKRKIQFTEAKHDNAKTALWLGEEKQAYMLINEPEKVEEWLRSGAIFFVEFETVTGYKLFVKPSGVNWFLIKKVEERR